MLEDDLTHFRFHHSWGLLAELLRRASLEVVASLEAIADFSAALSVWLEPGRQHDAAEFTHYLGTKVPVLSLHRSETRIQVQDRTLVEWQSHRAYATPLAVSGSCIPSLAALVRSWSQDGVGIQAYVEAAPVVFLHIDRFVVEAGVSAKRSAPLDLAGNELALPVFMPDSIEVQWHLYKIAAYVIHLGDSWENGHYITAIPCSGSYVVVNDDNPCTYHSTLAPELNRNVYLVFLVKILRHSRCIGWMKVKLISMSKVDRWLFGPITCLSVTHEIALGCYVRSWWTSST